MRPFVCLCLLIASAAAAGADTFRFLYHEGDQYRYLGGSTQRVTVDGRFLQDAVLSYRIQYRVAGVFPDGSGQLAGHISYLTDRLGFPSALAEEFDTGYRADDRGRFTIPPGQVMPVVRHVPTFPEGDLKPGDTWTAKGEEVHDLREDFGIPEPVRIGFDVAYTYEGPMERDGKILQVIRSDYSLYQNLSGRSSALRAYPIRISGHSTQKHYFNLEKGREDGYDEDYSLVLSLNDGRQIEYSGTGESHLLEAQAMNRPQVAEEVKQQLADRGFPDVKVTVVPGGVTINLDNINFPGDSAALLPSEREKLRLIGEVLRRYPDRDILVEGHTAIAASRMDPQKLSEDRAAAVGKALMQLGVRTEDHIVYRGWGGSHPLATNSTEEGRALNRRVEITLLEN